MRKAQEVDELLTIDNLEKAWDDYWRYVFVPIEKALESRKLSDQLLRDRSKGVDTAG